VGDSLYGTGRRAPLPTWLKDWQGDGIIARVDSPQIAAALRRTRLPVVDVSAERFRSEFSPGEISTTPPWRGWRRSTWKRRDFRISRIAETGGFWSRQRGAEFKRCLAAAGRRCVDFGEKAKGGRLVGCGTPGDRALVKGTAEAGGRVCAATTGGPCRCSRRVSCSVARAGASGGAGRG